VRGSIEAKFLQDTVISNAAAVIEAFVSESFTRWHHKSHEQAGQYTCR